MREVNYNYNYEEEREKIKRKKEEKRREEQQAKRIERIIIIALSSLATIGILNFITTLMIVVTK